MLRVGNRDISPYRMNYFKKELRTFWRKGVPQVKHKLVHLAFDPAYTWVVGRLLLFLEILLNIWIVNSINYTEIDWKAYMEQIHIISNGTFDYSKVEGGTGPLVYPAGHVYFYSLLYFVTDAGNNIRLAQYIFVILYLFTLSIVFSIYNKVKRLPPYVLIFMCCTSYRIHSIYVLRLFNDPVAMLLCYAAIYCFINNHWRTGCLLYSLSVGVKMNILLFAPALFLLLLYSNGWRRTISLILLCTIVQVMIALPFLVHSPYNYIARSFNLGRVFFYKWTVNWRFLPEDIFLDHWFHKGLLVAHIAVLIIYFIPWIRKFGSNGNLQQWNRDTNLPLSPNLVLLPMFMANFIGMAFSRTLHYQFYIWYYHTLPYLLWTVPMSVPLRLCILGVIELCWNTYPSTNYSSVLLHICHATILYKHLRSQQIDIKRN